MNSGRARGALLGQAIGDALGTTLEFQRTPEAPWDKFLTGPHADVTGDGPFSVEPGQVTDDTMMAACLATSLREKDAFDLEDVAERYAAWRVRTFDCGMLTGMSLSLYRNGTSPEHSGKAAWLNSGKSSAGNGSLMRTSPIGVFFNNDPEALVEVSIYDSNITHFDPRCSLACAAFNSAIGCAVRSDGPVTKEAMVAEALSGLKAGMILMSKLHPDVTDDIIEASRLLESDLDDAKQDDPDLYGSVHIHGAMGFVRVAFRLAFWELLHAPDWRTGIVDAVNRGGDTDTNGAIVGALMGAFYGAEGIPEEWAKKVLECDPREPFNRDGPWHPMRLMEMLDALQ